MSARHPQTPLDNVPVAIDVLAGLCRRAGIEGFASAPTASDGALLIASAALPPILRDVQALFPDGANVTAPLEKFENLWRTLWGTSDSPEPVINAFRQPDNAALLRATISLLTRIQFRLRDVFPANADGGHAESWHRFTGDAPQAVPAPPGTGATPP